MSNLPPLSFFAARSFWLLAAALAVQIADLLGYNLGDAEMLGNHAADAVTGILALWAYIERVNPNRKLTVTGPLK